MDPLEFATHFLGLTLFPEQVRILQAGNGEHVETERRRGKSFALAVLALYQVYTRPGSRVLLLSPTRDIEQTTFGYVERLLAEHPALEKCRCGSVEHPRMLRFQSGGWIAGYHGRRELALLGPQADAVYVDEPDSLPAKLRQAAQPIIDPARTTLSVGTTGSAPLPPPVEEVVPPGDGTELATPEVPAAPDVTLTS